MCCWEVKRKTLWSRHWDIIKVKTPFHWEEIIPHK